MADRTLRFSRRKLLQLGSLAPLAVLLKSGATAEEIAETVKTVDSGVLAKLWDRGHAHNPDVEEGKFKGIATTLWMYLEAGMEARGGKKMLPTDQAKLIALADKMYDQPNEDKLMSGDLLTDAMAGWTMDDPVTNGCAYLCGFYTAEVALDLEKEIDWEIYRVGFKRTERQMKATLKRLRASQGKAADDNPRRGAGC